VGVPLRALLLPPEQPRHAEVHEHLHVAGRREQPLPVPLELTQPPALDRGRTGPAKLRAVEHVHPLDPPAGGVDRHPAEALHVRQLRHGQWIAVAAQAAPDSSNTQKSWPITGTETL
jgi:hypothetical protein